MVPRPWLFHSVYIARKSSQDGLSDLQGTTDIKGRCPVSVKSFSCSIVRDVLDRPAVVYYKSSNIQFENIPIAVPLNPFVAPKGIADPKALGKINNKLMGIN